MTSNIINKILKIRNKNWNKFCKEKSIEDNNLKNGFENIELQNVFFVLIY